MKTLHIATLGLGFILSSTLLPADETQGAQNPPEPWMDEAPVIDAGKWLTVIDGELSFLDPQRDKEAIDVLKQFKRTIDPNKHGKIYAEALRVSLFKMKNTLPELYEKLVNRKQQNESLASY